MTDISHEIETGQITVGCRKQQMTASERTAFWRFCERVAAGSKARSLKLRVPHEITAYDIDELLVDGRYRCAVSGIHLEKPNGRRDPFSPSLDRIEPALGYVRGNIRIVCLIVNMAMNRWGETALRKLIEEYWKGQ